MEKSKIQIREDIDLEDKEILKTLVEKYGYEKIQNAIREIATKSLYENEL